MGVTEKIDKSRMMGTAAFKKEINHLLYANSFTGSDAEFDAGLKGEKTCELLYETESVRGARCIFQSGLLLCSG